MKKTLVNRAAYLPQPVAADSLNDSTYRSQFHIGTNQTRKEGAKVPKALIAVLLAGCLLLGVMNPFVFAQPPDLPDVGGWNMKIAGLFSDEGGHYYMGIYQHPQATELYVVASDENFTESMFYKFDVSDRTDPDTVWSYNLLDDGIHGTDVCTFNDWAYIANYEDNGSIAIYNVTNGPYGTQTFFEGEDEVGYAYFALDVTCGHLVAVDDSDYGFHMFEINNQDGSLDLVGRCLLTPQCMRWDVNCQSPSWAYVACADSTMRVIDATNFDVEFTFETDAACRGVRAYENHLFVCCVDGGTNQNDHGKLYSMFLNQNHSGIDNDRWSEIEIEVSRYLQAVEIFSDTLAVVAGRHTNGSDGVVRVVCIHDIQHPGIIGGYINDGTPVINLEAWHLDQIALVYACDEENELIIYDFFEENYDQFEVPLTGSKYEKISTYTYPGIDRYLMTGADDNIFLSIEDFVWARNDDNQQLEEDGDPNDILDFLVSEGYEIICDENSEWSFYGWLVHPKTQYTILENPIIDYNYIGFPFALTDFNIVDALDGISGIVEIVYDDDGHIWIPGVYNSIGDMDPGSGYMVATSEDATFSYNQPGAGRRVTGSVQVIAEIDGAPTPTGIPYAVIFELGDDLREYNPYALEVYDGNLLVGRAAFQPEYHVTPVICWKGDPIYDLPGFRRGAQMRFVIRNENEEVILSSLGDREYRFLEAGYTYVAFGEGELFGGGGEGGDGLIVGDAYPEPFNPVLTVPFTLTRQGEIEINFYNLLGQKIFTNKQQYSAGQHQFVFNTSANISDLGSGIYFVELRFGLENHVQKVMLLK